jgi:hypothetical protein
MSARILQKVAAPNPNHALEAGRVLTGLYDDDRKQSSPTQKRNTIFNFVHEIYEFYVF